MNREIKFRAWSIKKKMIYEPVISDETDGGETSRVCLNTGLANTDSILMQYTGLQDKNGKDVYEGDVITYCGYNYVIEFQDGCFGVMDYEDFISLSVLQLNGWDIDPIGNIYENPELLEAV